MALSDPLQWIIIGVIVVVIFLWGPQKIPELARGLGRAKREFEQASKEFQSAATGNLPAAGQKSTDQILIETAKQLGIVTEGKTREEIAAEIVAKSKSVQS